MSVYEIGLLGDIAESDSAILIGSIARLIDDFHLKVGSEVMVRVGESFKERDTHAATVVAYFGGAAQADKELAAGAFTASVPFVPTIPEGMAFLEAIPTFLQALNGHVRRPDDPDMIQLATVLLECVGLLRPQRRVFVSYRRVESRSAAVQLHDLLSGNGFDVFLDTHEIRPGEPFQEVLWHRLCDSDVMVMLDTPTYFESKWTRQELGRARAKEIHVLRVVWPDHSSGHADFGESIYLANEDLVGNDGPLKEEVALQIVIAVERIRSRSIASRYMSITGKLRIEIEKLGGKVEGIGVHRAIALRLPGDTKLWGYPVVGIPTADLLNDVFNKAKSMGGDEKPVLFYDHVGIRERWRAHLKWLDDNISAVRAVQVAEAAWVLAAWEDSDA